MLRTISLCAALAAFALPALAADPVPFRLCTGREDGNYTRAGHMLKRQVPVSSLKLEIKTIQGSIENLDRVVAGECDGAFVQSDALLVYSSRNAQVISNGATYDKLLRGFAAAKPEIQAIANPTR